MHTFCFPLFIFRCPVQDELEVESLAAASELEAAPHAPRSHPRVGRDGSSPTRRGSAEREAGQYQPQWNLTGGYVKYPYSISAFAPMSLLGDASTWLALSWTTELWL